MEYRARITIPGIPVALESAWEPLLSRLESDHGKFGPVLAWDGGAPDWPDAVVVMSTDAENEATAAGRMIEATLAALRDTGLGDRYTSRVELEPA